ncbi:MAG: thiamine-phosphate kinase, partial [Gammaproteobacteria bacterium]|nr:thiamine-phosphate kinase [Gammaproteobacteria bacterium]
MDEFSLIDCIVSELGSQAKGPWIALGPGDDAAVIAQSPGCQTVASIDTLIAERHFPTAAPAELVGYRALMVSLSDLAAMAAVPRYALVALTLPRADKDWVVGMARGMADAARLTGTYICGGNLSRGPLSITVSVHGEVPLNG